jgi:hypothetical protein
MASAGPYSPECVEGNSLLKNSLYGRFGPRSGPKYTVCGAIWSVWSPIRSHCELSTDFFNRLVNSEKFSVAHTPENTQDILQTLDVWAVQECRRWCKNMLIDAQAGER